MSLVLRQGLDADRLLVVFEQGELVWSTDTQKLYIGDGTVLGGLDIVGGLHNHNNIYYTEAEVDSFLLTKMDLSDFNLQFNAHTGNLGLHRQINDSGITLIDLWSASKITASLLLKSDAIHNHNSLYYTKVEVDGLISPDTFVQVNATDSGTGYLEDKVASGNGVTAFVNTVDFADNRVQFIADVWIENINGIAMPVFNSSTKGKVLSVQSLNFQWDESSLSNNDWIQISFARDADSGHVMPFNGTIVGITYQCENANNGNKDINLYMQTAGTITTVANISGSGEQLGFDNSLNIDFSAGEKLRLRSVGGGNNITDTVIQLIVQWRL